MLEGNSVSTMLPTLKLGHLVSVSFRTVILSSPVMLIVIFIIASTATATYVWGEGLASPGYPLGLILEKQPSFSLVHPG